MIITTNHPELLDDAFKRPGRIDVNLHVGHCIIEHIQEMFDFFFSKQILELNLHVNFCKLFHKSSDFNTQMTPAELGQICMNNYNNPELAQKEIIKCVELRLEAFYEKENEREKKNRNEKARKEQAREEQAREEQAREGQAREGQAREEQAREEQAREEQAREEQAREEQAREEQIREKRKEKNLISVPFALNESADQTPLWKD